MTGKALLCTPSQGTRAGAVALTLDTAGINHFYGLFNKPCGSFLKPLEQKESFMLKQLPASGHYPTFA